jgi:heme/copper-type cytochrome/quinol oxidase subunit 4
MLNTRNRTGLTIEEQKRLQLLVQLVVFLYVHEPPAAFCRTRSLIFILSGINSLLTEIVVLVIQNLHISSIKSLLSPYMSFD